MAKQTENERKEKDRIRARKFREENPEIIKERKRIWRLNNLHKIAIYRSTDEYKRKSKDRSSKWRKENPEKAARWFKENTDKLKTWRDENPEKLKEYNFKWRNKNKEHEKERCKKYRKDNPEKIRATHTAWIKSHPEWRKIQDRNQRAKRRSKALGKLSLGLVNRLLTRQKNRCAICRKSLKKTGYHLDHIIPLARGGKNVDSNIQLTCPKCNREKHDKDPIVFMREKGFLL